MIKSEFEVVNPQGLHARPAAMLCKITSQYQSDVKFAKDGIEVNGKSVMGVMMLAAEFGSKVNVQINGDDESAMWEEIQKLVKNNFNE